MLYLELSSQLILQLQLLLLIVKPINIMIIININNINANKAKNNNRYQQLPQYVITWYNNEHLMINTNSKSF